MGSTILHLQKKSGRRKGESKLRIIRMGGKKKTTQEYEKDGEVKGELN